MCQRCGPRQAPSTLQIRARAGSRVTAPRPVARSAAGDSAAPSQRNAGTFLVAHRRPIARSSPKLSVLPPPRRCMMLAPSAMLSRPLRGLPLTAPEPQLGTRSSQKGGSVTAPPHGASRTDLRGGRLSRPSRRQGAQISDQQTGVNLSSAPSRQPMAPHVWLFQCSSATAAHRRVAAAASRGRQLTLFLAPEADRCTA